MEHLRGSPVLKGLVLWSQRVVMKQETTYKMTLARVNAPQG